MKPERFEVCEKYIKETCDLIPDVMKFADYLYKARACGYIGIWKDFRAMVSWDGETCVSGRVEYNGPNARWRIRLNAEEAEAADMDIFYDLQGFEV